MKKIFSILIILAVIAFMTSCGTSKSYVGEAKGFSQNEQVAREISRLNAASESSIKHTYNVEVEETIETTDKGGEPTTVFSSVKTGTSQATFVDNEIITDTRKRGDKYESRAFFKGKFVKKRENK